jgi:hypothetical protein
MDMLDRIAALLRALFGDSGSTERPAGGSGARPGSGSSRRPVDPDLAAASGGRRGESARGGSPPESLRADFANLEVPFGADGETVRRSYKRLVLHYHPDRHGGDPEKLRVATEITKKVNESFERIRSFQERNAGER